MWLGALLARLETHAVLREFVGHVSRIQPTDRQRGRPTVHSAAHLLRHIAHGLRVDSADKSEFSCSHRETPF